MNPLLIFLNLQKAAVKTFKRFSNEIFMVLNLQEAAVKPLLMFTRSILGAY